MDDQPVIPHQGHTPLAAGDDHILDMVTVLSSLSRLQNRFILVRQLHPGSFAHLF